jgi:hypothetical protein
MNVPESIYFYVSFRILVQFIEKDPRSPLFHTLEKKRALIKP